MTEATLRRIVRVWAKRLGLVEWIITMKFDAPLDATDLASVERSRSYDEAELRFGPTWREWSPDIANGVVVHELVHILMGDVDSVFSAVEPEIAPPTWRMLESRYDHAAEALVDRVARRLIQLGGVV